MSIYLSLILHKIDLPKPLHNFLLIFLKSNLILKNLKIILFTNPIFSTFSLNLILIYISLFYILSNSHFITTSQLLIYINTINILIIFTIIFINNSKYYQNFHL
ncbi:hypothetical protein E2H86_25650 [Pseudomonas putida]|nr:hypothetical protein E2H86_25650 [Pseudomonas putida]